MPAFANLIRENQAMVFSICRNFLRDDAVAEEIAQDVFLELHQHLGELETAGHVTNWLRKVTVRRCIDYARRPANQPKLNLQYAPEPAGEAEPADPFVERAIGKLMNALPERQRMVVVLRYQEDMDPAEIAEMLNIPANTVKSCLHRTLALLREKLERTGIRQ